MSEKSTLLADLKQHITKGGYGVYLDLGLNNNWDMMPYEVNEDNLPVEFTAFSTRGHWIPIAHFMGNNELFEGLPTEGFMDDFYRNVCPDYSVVPLPDSKSFSGEFFYRFMPEDMRSGWGTYVGPSQSYTGSSAQVFPVGQGKAFFSTLKLLDNLGKDPVADILMLNLLDMVSQ